MRYIGKAGVLNGKGNSSIRKRFQAHLKWCQQKKNKHPDVWDIWRINNPSDLLVTRRITEDEAPGYCKPF